MFDYQKYSASLDQDHKPIDVISKNFNLTPDRASVISLSTTTTEDELEINEFYFFGWFKVFKLLPIIAGFCLIFDGALAILTLETPIAFTFIPLVCCTSIIWFLTSRGLRKELIKFLHFTFWLLIFKSLQIIVLMIFELIALYRPEVIDDIFKFTISTQTLQSVFVLLCVHLLFILLQLHVTSRAIEIIRKRDLIYVIPALKGARLRPSIKLVVEKLRNQNLGVQVF
ncbi:hypothetical protein M3Y97_00165600 [Aphelenchoides bicaudatus]|nr:hypothetical protein M3Y97_00165600 [Aphelenchoides bicaudatus]